MEENNNASTIERYRTAIELFNAHPTGNQAQNYLVEHGVIALATIDLEFTIILNTYATYVDKAALGTYLGDINNAEKCRQYIQTINVSGMVVDEALRKFLGKFALPGEAQKIDRILEIFAAEYLRQNPDAAPSADSLYMLCFAVIMLNTDLRSQNPVKMSKAQFVQLVTSSSPNAFTPALLELIYDRIAASPLM